MLRLAEFGLIPVRLLLGFLFLLAGATKLVDPVGLRKGLRDFGLPGALAAPAVILLPLVELGIGAALIPAGLAWYGAWGALALLVVFLIAITTAMARGRKPDCRCFGQMRAAPVGRSTLIRDALLALCAAWLVSRGRGQVGPDLWIWFSALNGDQRKFAVIVACLAGVFFFRQLDRSRPVAEPVESPEPFAIEDAPDPERIVRRARVPVRPPEEPGEVKPGPHGIGLPIGTPAPDFELPGLTGGRRSLQSLRDQRRDLLLVFSNPYCESCVAITPRLVRWTQEAREHLNFVVISRGNVADNLAKLKGFDPSHVLLQGAFEVSEAYDCNATPAAVLVGTDGLIRSELAVGGAAIQQLIASAKPASPPLPDGGTPVANAEPPPSASEARSS